MFEVAINGRKNYFSSLFDAVVFLKTEHDQHLNDTDLGCQSYLVSEEETIFRFSIRECEIEVTQLGENRANFSSKELGKLKAFEIMNRVEKKEILLDGTTLYYDR